MKFSSPRVVVVVAVNFCMTFKTHCNSVRDVAKSIVCTLNDVVNLHLHAAEPMANAATAVTCHHELVCIFLFETGHVVTPFYRQATKRADAESRRVPRARSTLRHHSTRC